MTSTDTNPAGQVEAGQGADGAGAPPPPAAPPKMPATESGSEPLLKRLGLGTWKVLSSFGLSAAIFALLTLVTWLGTEAQVELGLFKAQKRYFESWIFIEDLFSFRVGGDQDFVVRVPLPGGYLLMVLLFVNLVIGGIARMRIRARNVGVLITHIGIIWLLLGSMAKEMLFDEGQVTLYPGDSSQQYASYHDWELLVEEPLEDPAESAGPGKVRQWQFLGDRFADAEGDGEVVLKADGLPFDVQLTDFYEHAVVAPVGWQPTSPLEKEMFVITSYGPKQDGFQVLGCKPRPENERNSAACVATVLGTDLPTRDDHAPLWAGERRGWLVEVGERRFHLTLRRRHYDMPFEIELDEFIHEFHPNTRQPREFQSQVTVLDGDEEVPARIRMNEPLRRDGMIVFQSGWGPQKGPADRELYSVFQVVRNPADQSPYHALWVITAGMLLHFLIKLSRFLGQAFGGRR